MSKNIKVSLIDKDKLIFELQEDANKGDYVSLKDSTTVSFDKFTQQVTDLQNKVQDAQRARLVAQAQEQAINNFKSSNQYLDLIKKTSQYEQEIKNFDSKKEQIASDAVNAYKKQQEYLNLINEVNTLKQNVAILKQEKENAINNYKSSSEYTNLLKAEVTLKQKENEFDLIKKNLKQEAIVEFKHSSEFLQLNQQTEELKANNIALKNQINNAIDNFKASKEYLDLIQAKTELKQQQEQFNLLKENLKNQAIEEFKKSNEFTSINKELEDFKKQNITLKNELDNAVTSFKASNEYQKLLQDQSQLKSQEELFKAQINNIKNEAVNDYKNSNDYLKLIQQNETLNNQNINLNNTVNNLKQQMDLTIKNEVLEAEKKAVIAYKQTEEYKTLIDKVKEQETEIERLNYLHGGKNVKLIGEELEQYIWSKYQDYFGFNSDSSLEKTNDVIENTKPDFLFTVFDVETNNDVITKIPYGTVIIEAKNETLDSKNKHKNADYLPKLDLDMKKRKADFGVLVTTLERDQQFSIYMDNNYKNIFIVRPDWLYPLLNLLKVIFLKRKEINRLNLSLKTSKDLIDEFEEFKNNILNNSFKNMQANLEIIGDSAQKIIDQANKITEAKDKIVSKHMNAMKNNINKFKINSFSKKLDAINEAKLIASNNGDLKEIDAQDLIKLENKN